MTKEERSVMYAEVMDGFNFEKVHRVMVFLGWSYADIGVPSLERIKETALRNLESVGNYDSVSSGGFLAEKLKNEQGNEYFRLSFVVEECESANA